MVYSKLRRFGHPVNWIAPDSRRIKDEILVEIWNVIHDEVIRESSKENTRVPDAKVGELVENIPTRVASFDRLAIAAANQIINNHAGLAELADLEATRRMTVAAVFNLMRLPALRILLRRSPAV